MKKKWLAIATAVALSVGLAAAPSEANSKKDRTYVALVKSYSDLANYGSDRQLIKMGKQVCKTFDTGLTLYEILSYMTSTLDTPEAEDLFAATVAAAVVVYCPKHENKLR